MKAMNVFREVVSIACIFFVVGGYIVGVAYSAKLQERASVQLNG